MIYSKNESKIGYFKGVAIRDRHIPGNFIPTNQPLIRDDLHIIHHSPIEKGLCFQKVLLFKDGFKSVLEVRAQDATKSIELLECLDEKDRKTITNLAKFCIENRINNKPEKLFDSLKQAERASPENKFLGIDHKTGGRILKVTNLKRWGNKWCHETKIGVHISY